MPPVPEQIWSQQANPPHSDCLPIIDKLTIVDGMNHFQDYMSSKENVPDSLRDLKGSLFSCPSLPVHSLSNLYLKQTFWSIIFGKIGVGTEWKRD